MSLSDEICLSTGKRSFHLSRGCGGPDLRSRYRCNLCLSSIDRHRLKPGNLLIADSLEPPGSRVHIGSPSAYSLGDGVTDPSPIDRDSVGDDGYVHTFTVALSDAFLDEGCGNGKLAQASPLTHAENPAGMSGQMTLYAKEKSHELVKTCAT